MIFETYLFSNTAPYHRYGAQIENDYYMFSLETQSIYHVSKNYYNLVFCLAELIDKQELVLDNNIDIIQNIKQNLPELFI